MLCTAKRENGARLQEKSYLCMMNRYKTHFMVTLLRLRFFLTYFGSFVWMKNGRDHYFMQGAGSPPCANRVVLYDLDFFFLSRDFLEVHLEAFPSFGVLMLSNVQVQNIQQVGLRSADCDSTWFISFSYQTIQRTLGTYSRGVRRPLPSLLRRLSGLPANQTFSGFITLFLQSVCQSNQGQYTELQIVADLSIRVCAW